MKPQNSIFVILLGLLQVGVGNAVAGERIPTETEAMKAYQAIKADGLKIAGYSTGSVAAYLASRAMPRAGELYAGDAFMGDWRTSKGTARLGLRTVAGGFGSAAAGTILVDLLFPNEAKAATVDDHYAANIGKILKMNEKEARTIMRSAPNTRATFVKLMFLSKHQPELGESCLSFTHEKKLPAVQGFSSIPRRPSIGVRAENADQ